MAFITSSSPGQQQQQEEEEEEETKQSHLLPLLISETSPNLMMCPSITTVRFYESKDGTGRLVSSDDSVKLSAPLRLSEGGSKAIGCFSEFIGPEFAIRPGMSQQEMRERVLHCARVWIGRDTVDKDEPLFIVSVVAASRDAMDFAVVISMSHVIADGYTYGEVLKMLQPEAFNNGDDHADMVVEPLLRFDRVSEFTDEPAVSPPLGFALTKRKRYKVNMFLHEKLVRPFKPSLRVRSFEVSQSWIQEQKKLHVPTAEAPFISTSDIITSWYLSREKYEVGMMVADLRNRPDALREAKVNSSNAGNYIGIMPFKEDLYSTPAGIRSLLVNNLQSQYGEEDIPLFWNFIRGPHIGVVTQWTYMPTEVPMPTYKQVLHQPVVSLFVGPNHEEMFDKGFWPSLNFCIIYRPTPSTLGIMLWDRGDTTGDTSIIDNPLIVKELHPPSTH